MNVAQALHTIYSFDIESTSGNPLEAHVVTATLTKLVKGQAVDYRSWTIKPAVEIPAEAIEIHGITNEWISEHGGDPKENLAEILTMVAQVLRAGVPLVIYNAAYDLTLLESQAAYYSLPSLQDRLEPEHFHFVIDPFVLIQGYESYRTVEGHWGKGYKLPEVCARYGVEFVESHDAMADSIGAGKVAIAFFARHPEMLADGPAALFEKMVDWRGRIQAGLREYFDSKKKEHDGVDGGWPLHTAVQRKA